MSGRRTLATSARVLRQLRRDPRTVAMLLVVPCVLMTLLRWVYDDSPLVFDQIGPALLGIFPFIVMFLVSSVAMLRERTSGTLERLLTMPLAKTDLLGGYGLAFGLVAVAQALLACILSLAWLGLDVQGSAAVLVLIAVLDGLLGMALGLALSAFAANEFQAVQFMPAVVLPQLLVCGLFAARSTMAAPLRWAADVLPLSYAVDAMQRLAAGAALSGRLLADVLLLAALVLLALGAGAATLRRRTG